MMQAGEPMWLLIDLAGQRHMLSAVDGRRVSTDAARAGADCARRHTEFY